MSNYSLSGSLSDKHIEVCLAQIEYLEGKKDRASREALKKLQQLLQDSKPVLVEEEEEVEDLSYLADLLEDLF